MKKLNLQEFECRTRQSNIDPERKEEGTVVLIHQ